MYLVTRTQRDVASLAGPIREAVWGVDPTLPVGTIRTLERAHYENAASDYALLTLFVTFSLRLRASSKQMFLPHGLARPLDKLRPKAPACLRCLAR